jgi:sodium-dependent phosphate cotransporter
MEHRQQSGVAAGLLRLAAVLALLFIFLVGIKGLGGGFKLLGKDLLQAFFTSTENPFFGLVVGILATTLVQSSSVTTSMIVALVAAPENPLPVANAVPMVMGANIGTTVTNTVVSLAHMGHRGEFRRAFAVATCHDFFNFSAVLILLPLELLTGFLSKTAAVAASLVSDWGGVTYKSPLKTALKGGVEPLEGLASTLFEAKTGQAVVLIIISAVLIVGALFLLVKLLRSMMRTRVEGYITRALGQNAVVSMIVGVVVTVMVQSSSITTSLLVPLGGAGLLTLERAFPITLGANIGTTVTALLASLAVSGVHATAGIQIALVHLFFNLVGILLIYPVPAVRRLPLAAASGLAQVATQSRRYAIIYSLGLFYGLPGALIFLQKALAS